MLDNISTPINTSVLMYLLICYFYKMSKNITSTDEETIKEIVKLVFKKASEGLGKPTKNALSEFLSKLHENNDDLFYVSKKTFERLYDKYINKREGISSPDNTTIDFLCIYLGYENYLNFVTKHKKKPKRKLVLYLVMLLLISTGFYNITFRNVTISSNQNLNITVFKIDENNVKTELGKLDNLNNHTLNLKLFIGETELYYYATDDGFGEEFPGSEIIKTLPFWKPMPIITLSKI